MSKFISHLRSHSRRADLSQDEMAHLIGSPRDTEAVHYERFLHEPTVRAAMAIEVIFGARLKDLFPTMYDKVQVRVRMWASKILRQLPVGEVSEQKIRSLLAIAEPPLEDLRWEPVTDATL